MLTGSACGMTVILNRDKHPFYWDGIVRVDKLLQVETLVEIPVSLLKAQRRRMSEAVARHH
jgi:hypothetical protein